MKEEKIKEIIKKKVSHAARLGKKMENNFDKETIHNFRVVVKSLRSFLRLLYRYYKFPGLNLPKKFKRLYHIAGAIRDAQLELEKTIRLELAPPGYAEHLNRMIAQQKKEWNIHYSKKIFRELSRFSAFEFDAIPPPALADFIESKMSLIARLSKPGLITDNQLHSIRKLIKDVVNTSRIAEKHWRPAFKKINGGQTHKLRSIAEEIGNYNDKRIMLGHLILFSSHITEPVDKKNIKKLSTEMTKKLRAEKQNILQSVRDLFGSSAE